MQLLKKMTALRSLGTIIYHKMREKQMKETLGFALFAHSMLRHSSILFIKKDKLQYRNNVCVYSCRKIIGWF